jgi:hypothetical protein
MAVPKMSCQSLFLTMDVGGAPRERQSTEDDEVFRDALNSKQCQP